MALLPMLISEYLSEIRNLSRDPNLNNESYHLKHSKAETIWPEFCLQYFQTPFIPWNLLYFYTDFATICSLWAHWY